MTASSSNPIKCRVLIRRLVALAAAFCLIPVVSAQAQDSPESRWALDGAHLAQPVTNTDPAPNGELALEHTAAFDQDGGWVAIQPLSEEEEFISYTGRDSEAHLLLGIGRESPAEHPNGSFVAANIGSGLVDDIETAGGEIAVVSVDAFDQSGGVGTFEPGTTREEPFSYSGIDRERDVLLGVVRSDPHPHDADTLVLAGEPYREPTESEASGSTSETPFPAETSEPEASAADPSPSDASSQTSEDDTEEQTTAPSGETVDP